MSIENLPHRPDLADVALRQARRRKHAARTAVVGGTAIAVAAVIPFGCRDGRPARRQAPGQQRPAAKTVTVDIEKLKQGAAPVVPWSKNGEVFVGDEQILVSKSSLRSETPGHVGIWDDSERRILRTCSVVVETVSKRELWKACRWTEGGSDQRTDGPVAEQFSPDGRYVLAAQRGKVIVADARSGEPVLTARIAADLIHPIGWEADDGIVFTVWPDKQRVALVRCTVTGDCERASPIGKADKGREDFEHEGYWPYAILR